MISSSELQHAYINLYKHLRDYIWDFDIVEIIGKLETAVFERFPNTSSVSNFLNKLDSETRQTQNDDEELAESFSRFYNILNSADSYFADILVAHEVVK